MKFWKLAAAVGFILTAATARADDWKDVTEAADALNTCMKSRIIETSGLGLSLSDVTEAAIGACYDEHERLVFRQMFRFNKDTPAEERIPFYELRHHVWQNVWARAYHEGMAIAMKARISHKAN